ncbi:hypothetical protein [Sporosarcina trichiuri]|uniref:hypothetical protein n=1 Tax=Sporosarcina trichiuri TaxID=3056445 RepID=UPI0025B5548E|nr:hypothetical protein [Sporosarcina sp. 0.2-SM1T-5]WJY28275.1 hypothetical protein QWT68_04640 [Sporosarcina sp. 0.2-SM1T-5]
MRRIVLLSLLTLAAVVMAACGQSKENGNAEKETNGGSAALEESASLAASEQTLPPDFEQRSAAEEPEGFLAELTEDDDSYEAAWKLYGMEGERPDIDLSGQSVLFLSLQESSSCPHVPDTMELDGQQLAIEFEPLPDVCTADLAPRTLVFTVKKTKDEEALSSVLLKLPQQDVKVPITLFTSESQPSGDQQTSIESTGKITAIEDGRLTVMMDDMKQEVVVLTEQIDPAKLSSLEVGQQVNVTHDPAFTKSIPPQTNGYDIEPLEK